MYNENINFSADWNGSNNLEQCTAVVNTPSTAGNVSVLLLNWGIPWELLLCPKASKIPQESVPCWSKILLYLQCFVFPSNFIIDIATFRTNLCYWRRELITFDRWNTPAELPNANMTFRAWYPTVVVPLRENNIITSGVNMNLPRAIQQLK